MFNPQRATLVCARTIPGRSRAHLTVVPARLSVHLEVTALADCLERMQTCRLTGDAPTPDTKRWFEDPDPEVQSSLLAMFGRTSDPPSQIVELWVAMARSLVFVGRSWFLNRTVGNVEWLGTSMDEDYRQVGPTLGVTIGPARSGSLHGAVIAFAFWLEGRVVELHGADRLTSAFQVKPVTIREAWGEAIALMETTRRDPSMWGLLRQELDTEYHRLLPLPRPFEAEMTRDQPAVVAGLVASGLLTEDHDDPRQGRTAMCETEAILSLLEDDQVKHRLDGWPTVTRGLASYGFHDANYDHVRTLGAKLKRARMIRRVADHVTGSKWIEITAMGLKRLQQLRSKRRRA